jgi:tetratricopeptide (TPR) repeat protein
LSDFDDFEDEFADEKIQADIASDNKQVRADAIERLARKTFDGGNLSKAVVFLETVSDIRAEIEDFSGQASARMMIGFINAQQDHYEQALESFAIAAECASKAMHVTGEIDAIYQVGTMNRRLKRYGEAADQLRRALELAESEQYRFVAHIKTDYARMLRKIGRSAEAEVLLAQATEHFQANGFESNVPRAENELASALFEESNIELSLAKATEAFHLANYNENEREIDRAQFIMARCNNQLGNFTEALRIIEEMKQRPSFRKRQKHKVRTDLEFARALVGLDRRGEAADLLSKLIPVMKTYKLHLEVADALRMQGHNLLVVGDPMDAQQVLAEAATLADEHDFESILLEATTLLAICFCLQGRPAEMIGEYEKVASNPLNYGRLEFWMAAGELALHYARLGDVEVANRYVNAIKSAPSEQLTKHFKAQSQEARAVMLMAEGNKVKAKNLANKAMANYLLDDRIEDAQRCASMVAED